MDLRQASASCPSCSTRCEPGTRRHLWRGDSPQEAQAAAAQLRLPKGAYATVQALAEPKARTAPRHDSPIDAAAAQGVGITNKSERAEAVARALCRLQGAAPHGELVAALVKAGLDSERAEAEVVRMLATDVLIEPRAGSYRWLGGDA